jgi:hypothetical protein
MILTVTLVRISALILCLAVFLNGRLVSQEPDTDSIGARKASDALMADLVANRMGDVMEKLAPKGSLGWESFRKLETDNIDQCGRPLDSRIQNDGKPFLGQDVLPEGTKTDWTFQYRCKTTRKPSEYWITAEMVQAGRYKLALTCNPDPKSLPVHPK